MALSDTVQESMRDAEKSLRNALSFASRTERPHMVAHIAKLIAQIDSIISADELLDQIDEREPGSRGTYGPFYRYEDE
tara:strand:- start:360 stop:593 length:234 start_codon:yes stop_codon:yes gene_type:complete